MSDLICKCGHVRGLHLKGEGECVGVKPGGFANWMKCKCRKYDPFIYNLRLKKKQKNGRNS